MASYRYTHAIVCRIPDSYKTNSLRQRAPIDLENARKQHEAYVRVLRDLGVDVIELPPDERYPDCTFVEDMAVVCNGIALITKPGTPSRAKETEIIRTTLKKELELPIMEINDADATLDGGDVLFTGKEFFVGVSSRTNEKGALAVASAFPEYPCTPIKVNDTLHLKTLMAMAGPDIICVSTSKPAQEVLKRIEREATFRYQTLTVPDAEAANCIYINGTLIHRGLQEYPESHAIFEEKVDYPKRPLNFSELEKANASLSCCSLLIKKAKYIKRL